jgi:hypothetical protein
MGEKWSVNLACDSDSHVNHRVLLHATNLRRGAGGFTSPLKEGMLWIFSSRWLRPGLNPRSWVPEAGMLTARPPKPLHLQYVTCLNDMSMFEEPKQLTATVTRLQTG